MNGIQSSNNVIIRSPFRYPGGKIWLIPLVRKWLISFGKSVELIEPFAGGANIGLTAAFESLVNRVTLVELDQDVSAVWQTIICGDYEWLAQKVVNFELTLETAQEILAQTNLSIQEKAFQTILKNRINRGGILASGAGQIKNGENGKGIKSRWYPETLKKRVLEIGKIRDRITFIQGDGMAILEKNTHRHDIFFFIDPPYTAAGKKAGARLYNHYEIDHEKLFSITSSLKGQFLMTYDDSDGVRELIRKYNFVFETVVMKNTHHAKLNELLISRDLSWLGSE